MQLPSMLQGESLTRLLQGTALGAIGAIVIGFNWGGWMLESTSAKHTEEASKSAIISVLAPICAEKFQQAANVTDNMAMLKKESSYQRASFVDKGGWATMPGSDSANSGVAKACANILVDLK